MAANGELVFSKKVEQSQKFSKAAFTIKDLDDIYDYRCKQMQLNFPKESYSQIEIDKYNKLVNTLVEEYVLKKFGQNGFMFFQMLYQKIEMLIQEGYEYRDKPRYEKDLVDFLIQYYPGQKDEILDYFGGCVYLSLEKNPREEWDNIMTVYQDKNVSLTEYFKIIAEKRKLRTIQENSIKIKPENSAQKDNTSNSKQEKSSVKI